MPEALSENKPIQRHSHWAGQQAPGSDPGSGLFTGVSESPYQSNQPPRGYLPQTLRERGLDWAEKYCCYPFVNLGTGVGRDTPTAVLRVVVTTSRELCPSSNRQHLRESHPNRQPD